MSRAFDGRRRNFLIRTCLGWPLVRSINCQSPPVVDAAFHLHPHYRARSTFDDLEAKTKAGLDEFISEQDHDRIAAILDAWRRELLDSRGVAGVIEKALAADFLGGSLQPAESRMVRSEAALEVRHCTFSPRPFSTVRPSSHSYAPLSAAFRNFVLPSSRSPEWICGPAAFALACAMSS